MMRAARVGDVMLSGDVYTYLIVEQDCSHNTCLLLEDFGCDVYAAGTIHMWSFGMCQNDTLLCETK